MTSLMRFLVLLSSIVPAALAHPELGEHWTVVGAPPFAGRQSVQMVAFDGQIWVTGGRSQVCDEFGCLPETLHDDLWATSDARNWRRVLEHAPFGPNFFIGNAELFAFGEHLYYMSLPDPDPDSFDRIYWRSKDGLHWEVLTDTTENGMTVRRARTVFKDRLLLLGTPYSTADGVHWDVSPDYAPAPFDTQPDSVRAVAHGDYIYAFQSQQVWRSPDGFQWTELEGNTGMLTVGSVHDTTMLSFGGYLWLGGGSIAAGRVLRSMDGENWITACTTNCPARCRGMATLRESIFVLDPSRGGLTTSLSCADYLGTPHAADRSQCGAINLSELLRVVQFYNSGGLRCDAGSEDGYAAGMAEDVKGEGALEGEPQGEAVACLPHSSDYAPHDWRISLDELLRLVQLYNAGDYHPCGDGEETSEDGFCL